jgi:membrane protein implicated in regulation of membrane protease activity
MLDWLANNGWAVWLVLFLVLAAVEMMTLDLFFIMLSVGALAALVSSFLGAAFFLQIVIFCVVALLMIVLVRPVAMRHLRNGPREQRTNIDRLIGEAALTLEPVTDHSGMVKIGGDTWSARTADGAAIPAGRRVSVARIDGATAVVTSGPEDSSGPLPAQ